MVQGRAALVLCLLLASVVSGCSSVNRYLPSFLRGKSDTTPVPVRTIVILPLAYRAEDSRRDCDVCPNPLLMSETSAESALLVTAFFYEALSRHPRFDVVPYETVSRYQAETMDAMLADLTADRKLDAVLVGGLLEMRPREGDPRTPTKTGGASIYAAVLDVGTGETVWAQLFDGTKVPDNIVYKTYQAVVASYENRRPTAEEIAEYGVHKLVKNMAKYVK
ncbi:MAG: hypothetical protein E4H03_10270 [Myxococcales bacterium]|jgi:hypothetical protein|nr:MAG: hypothetical protein E4H03_10270 [Myxococcales bacterium]